MAKPGRLAQAKPRDDAAQLRVFIDNVPAMTVSFDENQRCSFANKRNADFFGFSAAEIVAKKIIAAVAAPFPLGSQKQSADIGTSIGIALYPADGRDADALVKAADAAMYSAKQAGRR